MPIVRGFGGDSERLEERILDALCDFGPWLPMTLTQGSESPIVRVLGVLWMFVWIPPAMFVCIIPLMLMLFVNIIGDAIRGSR